jgi:hypothetical protein
MRNVDIVDGPCLNFLFPAAAECELTDWAFDVEFDSGHPGKQVDVVGPDRAAAQSHIGRHHVEGLDQYADVFEDQRIGDATVLP